MQIRSSGTLTVKQGTKASQCVIPKLSYWHSFAYLFQQHNRIPQIQSWLLVLVCHPVIFSGPILPQLRKFFCRLVDYIIITTENLWYKLGGHEHLLNDIDDVISSSVFGLYGAVVSVVNLTIISLELCFRLVIFSIFLIINKSQRRSLWSDATKSIVCVSTAWYFLCHRAP